MSPIVRARLTGALVLFAAFGAGAAVGRYLPTRESVGVRIVIRASDRIPRELEDLNLNDSQRVEVRGILRRGADREDSILRSFIPATDAAIGVTDSEIRVLLTPAQKITLDAERTRHPLKEVRERKAVIVR